MSAANVSFNQLGNWRNGLMIDRGLEKRIGLDSLNRLAIQSTRITISFTLDSIGYIKSLDKLGFAIKNEPGSERTRVQITGPDLKSYEKAFVENGIQISIVPCDAIWMGVPKDSAELEMTRRVRNLYELNDDKLQWSAIIKLPRKKKISNGEIKYDSREWFERECNEISALDRENWWYFFNLEDFKIGNQKPNDALFLLSLLYAYGDFKVNKWLDKYDFKLNLSLDDDGLVSGLSDISSESTLPEINFQILLDFLKNNKVRFDPENGGKDITVNFPSNIYDSTAKSMKFFDRMHYLEYQLWQILNNDKP
mgnify:FL=1